MFSSKSIIGIIAVLLTFIGYAPYIRDIFKGKTKPHVFSWFVWGLDTAIVYALQVKAGAGPGSWVTLTITLILFFVFILGLNRGDKNIKRIDIIFLILALLALGLWLLIHQPILSIVLLCAVEMFGFVPTIRKSWNAPYTETLSFYSITAFRHALSIFALSQYNIVTWLYPVTWTGANALFALLLIARRNKLKNLPKI